MSNMNITELKIDPEFEKLLAPLQKIEWDLLERSILRDGCRDPIIIWRHTIVDGHNRYKICKKYELPFSTLQISFQSREEAVAWICANQLGRRNIPEGVRKYLIGKRYEMEKLLGAHNASGKNQYSQKEDGSTLLTYPVAYEDTAIRTRERLGKEYNISHGTVTKYNMYSTAVDRIARVAPEASRAMLNGIINLSQENTIELSKLPAAQIRELSGTLMEGQKSPVKYLNERRKDIAEQRASRILPEVSIKQMPKYDPDADFASISFTIPSWIESIERVGRTVESSHVSEKAANKLIGELTCLIQAADDMREQIKEKIHGRL